MRRATILIGALCGLGTASSAVAHKALTGWTYPLECCSGQDCAQVDGTAVKTTPRGYQVTVDPGSHPAVPVTSPGRSYDIPATTTKPSPDGEHHICLSLHTKRLLCFFAPPSGS